MNVFVPWLASVLMQVDGVENMATQLFFEAGFRSWLESRDANEKHGVVPLGGLKVRLLPPPDEQPRSPGDSSYQAAGNLAADFPDISPGKFSGNPTGARAGEYCHQKHQQARVTDQAQECSHQRSDHASNWYDNAHLPDVNAE